MPSISTYGPKWAVLAATLIVLVSVDPLVLGGLGAVAVCSWFVLYHSSLTQELGLLFPNLSMEQQAIHLLAVIKNTNVPIDTKLHLLSKLKAHIKRHHVPEAAISPSFEVVRTALSSFHLVDLVDLGFSTLSNLMKRLDLQDQQPVLVSQGIKTYPSILELLGHQKERVRLQAIQAFSDFWKASATEVEQFIRDSAIAGKSPRAKEAGMRWVVKMVNEYALQFRSFIPNILDCLEDVDSNVSETAQVTIIELFQHAHDAAKADLKKKLLARSVKKTIAISILSQLGLPIPIESESSYSAPSRESGPPKKTEVVRKCVTSISPPLVPAASKSEPEADQLVPMYIDTSRDLEDVFRDMHPHFEGKESEQNWTHREKSILKLRQITKGNAPQDFTPTYLVGIKGLLEGILKTVNSLRTTVSTNGCHLVQDIARAAGPGLDTMVEIILQSLIKLSGGTKTISAKNGDITVNAIFANVTYNTRLLQHIWNACQDKNVRPRTFAAGWLKTIITKHAHHKSVLEHAGSLDLIVKCLNKGLNDSSPAVRESMRSAYWAFWRVWPDRSESIMSALADKQKEQLLRDPSNPNPPKAPVTSTGTVEAKAPVISRLKETMMAAQKRAKLGGKELPERPGSAESSLTPKRPTTSSGIARPATSMATAQKTSSIAPSTAAHTGSLSSAPVRPTRPARKPESKKPATAEPNAARKQKKTVTPSISPAPTPMKSILKTPKSALKQPRNEDADSPDNAVKSIKKKVSWSDTDTTNDDDEVSTKEAALSPTKAAEDLTMVILTKDSLPVERISSTESVLSSKDMETAISSESVKADSPTSPIPSPMSPPGILGASGPTPECQPDENIPIPMSPQRILDSIDSTSECQPDENVPIPMSPQRILDSNNTTSECQPDENIPIPMSPQVILGSNGNHSPGHRGIDSQNSMSPKAILDVNVTLSPPVERATRKSMSPQAIFSRKENKVYQQQMMLHYQNQVQVYEDPAQHVDFDATPRPTTRFSVLEELPVPFNEPAMPFMPEDYEDQEGPEDHEQHGLFRDQRYHQGWTKLEANVRRLSDPVEIGHVIYARKILESGINQMRAKTLDAHGFRKLQGLIRSNDNVWSAGGKFDELLLLLLDELEAPNDEYQLHPMLVQDLKTQVLVTIRLMLSHQRIHFSTFYPRALCAVLSARKHYNGTCHIVCGLEETVEDILQLCELPGECIDAVLDLLESEEGDAKGSRTITMGLYVLGNLLRGNGHAELTLDTEEERRLGQLAARCLGATDPDIRRSVIEFTLDLHDRVAPKPRFWDMVAMAREDHRNLITYYLAKRAR